MILLFSSSEETPFIQQDLAFLSSRFDVQRICTRGISAVPLIWRGVRRTDAALVWFGSVYGSLITMLAGLSGKKVMIVAGGADLACIPSIKYGAWVSPWKRPLLRYLFRNAWRILAVDPSLAESARRLARYDGRNIAVLPTGYDPEVWIPGGARERMVACVAGCSTMSRLLVKGVDILLASAARMPDVTFVIVGLSGRALAWASRHTSANVELRPYAGRAEMVALYQRASVCCQPSRSEGLPNSICEAMLCGCIPVGTAVGGVANAIGTAGFLVEPENPDALIASLKIALDGSADLRARAREHIVRSFPLKRRQEVLAAYVLEAFA